MWQSPCANTTVTLHTWLWQTGTGAPTHTQAFNKPIHSFYPSKFHPTIPVLHLPSSPSVLLHCAEGDSTVQCSSSATLLPCSLHRRPLQGSVFWRGQRTTQTCCNTCCCCWRSLSVLTQLTSSSSSSSSSSTALSCPLLLLPLPC